MLNIVSRGEEGLLLKLVVTILLRENEYSRFLVVNGTILENVSGCAGEMGTR